jgi:hypothetical protein
MADDAKSAVQTKDGVWRGITLNMVERFFRDLTEKQISRGVFRSVGQLETAILDAIEHHNSDPKPYIWTAKASDILEKVKRARLSLNKAPSV